MIHRFGALIAGLCIGLGEGSTSSDDLPPELLAQSERCLQALMRNPVPGTALDRWARVFSDAGRPDAWWPLTAAHLQQQPEDPRRQLVAGLVLQWQGDHEAALRHFHRAEALDPDDWRAAERVAFVEAGRAEWARAREAAHRALSRQPPVATDRSLRFLAARAAYRDAEEDAAEAELADLLQRHSEDLRLREEVAEFWSMEGDRERARAAWGALRERASLDPALRLRACLEESALLDSEGEEERAVTLLEEQLERLDPQSWQARQLWRRLQDLWRRVGGLEAVVEGLRRRLERAPEDLGARLALADALADAGQDEEALAVYDAVLQRAPTHREALRRRRDHRERQGDRAGAIEDGRRLLASQPDALEDARRLAAALFAQAGDDPERLDLGAIDQGVAVLEEVRERRADGATAVRVARDLEDALARRRLGARREQDEEAEHRLREAVLRAWPRVLEFAPGDRDAVRSLGRFHRDEGDRAQALEVWSRLSRSPWGTTADRLALAEELVRHREHAEAATVLEGGLIEDPVDAELHAALCEVRVRQGRRDEADAALDRWERVLREGDDPAAWRSWMQRRIPLWVDEGVVASEASARAERPGPGERWLQARLALRRWDVEAAVEAYAQAFASDWAPEVLDEYLELLRREGREEQAIAALRDLAGRRPAAAFPLLERAAEWAIERDGPRLGRAVLAELEALASRPATVLMLRSRFESVHGDAENATDLLFRAVRLEPSDLAAREALARQLQQVGRESEAREHWWRCFELSAGRSDRREFLRHLLVDENLDWLVRRLQAAPRRSPAESRLLDLCLLDAVRLRDGDEEAASWMELLLARRPDDPELLREMVEVAHGAERPELALDAQRRLVEIDPADLALRRRLALLVEQESREEARALWPVVLHRSADRDELVDVVLRWRDEWDPEEALALAEAVWALDPEDPQRSFLVGCLAAETGQGERADEAFARCERSGARFESWRAPVGRAPSPEVTRLHPWSPSVEVHTDDVWRRAKLSARVHYCEAAVPARVVDGLRQWTFGAPRESQRRHGAPTTLELVDWQEDAQALVEEQDWDAEPARGDALQRRARCWLARAELWSGSREEFWARAREEVGTDAARRRGLAVAAAARGRVDVLDRLREGSPDLLFDRELARRSLGVRPHREVARVTTGEKEGEAHDAMLRTLLDRLRSDLDGWLADPSLQSDAWLDELPAAVQRALGAKAGKAFLITELIPAITELDVALRLLEVVHGDSKPAPRRALVERIGELLEDPALDVDRRALAGQRLVIHGGHEGRRRAVSLLMEMLSRGETAGARGPAWYLRSDEELRVLDPVFPATTRTFGLGALSLLVEVHQRFRRRGDLDLLLRQELRERGGESVELELAAIASQWWSNERRAATQAMQALAARHPEDPTLALAAARAWLAEGQPGRALEVYEAIDADSPLHRDWGRRIELALRTGTPDEVCRGVAIALREGSTEFGWTFPAWSSKRFVDQRKTGEDLVAQHRWRGVVPPLERRERRRWRQAPTLAEAWRAAGEEARRELAEALAERSSTGRAIPLLAALVAAWGADVEGAFEALDRWRAASGSAEDGPAPIWLLESLAVQAPGDARLDPLAVEVVAAAFRHRDAGVARAAFRAVQTAAFVVGDPERSERVLRQTWRAMETGRPAGSLLAARRQRLEELTEMLDRTPGMVQARLTPVLLELLAEELAEQGRPLRLASSVVSYAGARLDLPLSRRTTLTDITIYRRPLSTGAEIGEAGRRRSLRALSRCLEIGASGGLHPGWFQHDEESESRPTAVPELWWRLALQLGSDEEERQRWEESGAELQPLDALREELELGRTEEGELDEAPRAISGAAPGGP